jgi:hypothetical protein
LLAGSRIAVVLAALFAMDFKNAPGQEAAALQTRQAYLASLVAQKMRGTLKCT